MVKPVVVKLVYKHHGAYKNGRRRFVQFCRRVKSELLSPLHGRTQSSPTLLTTRHSSPRTRLHHVAFLKSVNAGDILLPVAVRDCFNTRKAVRWSAKHVHATVAETDVDYINKTSGLVIGGGGLFLRDTNPNNLSGWQWSCSMEMLRRIQVPIALFGVGYNRFRGQPDFAPVFKDHIRLLAEKSVYLGLRNSGSVRAVRSYLPPELHDQVTFQPCPTTVLRLLYPHMFSKPPTDGGFIAVNCAFDRSSLRFGANSVPVLQRIAESIKAIAEKWAIKYYAHFDADREFLPYLDSAGVNYDVVDLGGTSPESIIEAYRCPRLVIGMRGHAQLIPFGCGIPIISLVSHEKMRWFLEDIDAQDWGIEVDSEDLAERLPWLVNLLLTDKDVVRERIGSAQKTFWQISKANVERYYEAI